MEEVNYIELQRARDFGKKINATFEFIKQNFKPLTKSLLLIAGPAILIGSLMIGSFMGDFMGLTLANAAGGGNPEALSKYFLSFSFWAQIVLMFVFFIVSTIMSISTMNNYILLYGKNRTNQIAVQDVWDKVRGSLGIYIGSTLLMFLMAVVGVIALVLVIALFSVASPVFSVLGMFAGFGAFIYIMISVSLTLFIQTYEGLGFFDALSRSFKLVRGKWWSTFGLLFVLSLIGSTIAYFFMIPYYVVVMTTAIHKVSSPLTAEAGPSKILIMSSFTLYNAANLLLSSLSNIGTAFQYFNLVELKEAKGLMADIENVGKTDNTQRPEESY